MFTDRDYIYPTDREYLDLFVEGLMALADKVMKENDLIDGKYPKEVEDKLEIIFSTMAMCENAEVFELN